MDESKEREAFERWYATKQESFGTGALTLALKTARMDAWLARAALAQPEPEPELPAPAYFIAEEPAQHGMHPCFKSRQAMEKHGKEGVYHFAFTADQVRASILADRKRSTPEPELPALPEGEVMGTYGLTRLIRYTKGHMQSYALAAILADRKRRT